MLAVKGNQRQLSREVRRYFDAARERDFECEGIENDETAEDGHGRVESRSCYPGLFTMRLSDASIFDSFTPA